MVLFIYDYFIPLSTSFVCSLVMMQRALYKALPILCTRPSNCYIHAGKEKGSSTALLLTKFSKSFKFLRTPMMFLKHFYNVSMFYNNFNASFNKIYDF
jgi:hypothetical protein